jgi:maleylacetoacetate isomerase
MLELYSYYRSTASYRIRIALNYKQLDYKLIPVDLIAGEHHENNYLKHNQHGRVPTLVDGAFEIGQSAAILEYLEEKFPAHALLPDDINARAWVRYLSQIIISDTHPLNNSGIIKFLTNPLGFDKSQIKLWYHHWLKLCLDTFESILLKHPDCNNFCWGDNPTFADVCLIPQIYNAYRFEFPMKNYPTLKRIYEHCLSLNYFDKARPENQPDYIHNRPGSVVP